MAEVILGIPESIEDHWPGALQGDPTSLRRLSFYALRHPIGDSEWYPNNPAEDDIQDLLVDHLQDLQEHVKLKGLSRLEASELMAQSAEGLLALYNTVKTVQSSEPEVAIQATAALLDSQPVASFVMQASSPLYPNGRASFAKLNSEEFLAGKYRWGEKNLVLRSPLGSIEVPEALTEVIRGSLNDKLTERAFVAAANEIEPINPELQETLREAYGTKAANLMLFKDAVDKLPRKGDAEYSTQYVQIPDFIPVHTDVYKQWQTNREAFTETAEALRQKVLESVVPNQPHHVVAIRSSAVKSEDGQQVTGAGVYDSVAADPRDPEAFQAAIEQVYASVDSELAVGYRARFGIEDELMGLVIQKYMEDGGGRFGSRDVPYGTIDTMTNNNSLAKAEFQAGSLLYDRQRIFDRLLIGADMMETGSYLHTIPDHSRQDDLRNAGRYTISAVHAALFAEKVFGTPVQVECAGESVLQVRPLPKEAYVEPEKEVHFPEDREPLIETRAVGVGDTYLKILHGTIDNRDETGLAVFRDEHAFTVYGNEDAFPRKGGVLILHNDGKSGHVQMRTIERGLICLFPEVDQTLSLKLKQWGDETYVRIVSDGYRGAVYQLTDAELAEVSGKKELLQRVANGLLSLVESNVSHSEGVLDV